MKIYTKTGDDGTTGMIGGTRALKSDAAIECYGTVDELNATIGLAAAAAGDSPIADRLRLVQGELFSIGARLATPPGSGRGAALPDIDQRWVARLESQIDEAEGSLPPLQNFILPGGTELAARLHLARTVCRRAERLLVAINASRPVGDDILAYMNRLSDWLFVQARRANHLAGHPDVPWVSR